MSGSASLAAEKSRLRAIIKARRKQVIDSVKRSASATICQLIIRQRHFHLSRRIGLYVAANNEIDLSPLELTIRQRRKQAYYPVLNPLWISHTISHSMFFVADDKDLWQLNRFAIAEPLVPLYKKIPLWTLDMVLMPLVAFDSSGGRLGMGGGYYDRTFYRYRQLAKRGLLPNSQIFVGIGYEFQRVNKIPMASTDIRLDFMVTERGWFTCRE